MKTANGPAHCNQCKRLSTRKARRNRHRNASALSGTRGFSCGFWPVFGVGHHRDSVPATCTRLKKMQAIACVKMGCPGHQLAVLSLFFYSFFCHLGTPEDLSKLLTAQTDPHWLQIHNIPKLFVFTTYFGFCYFVSGTLYSWSRISTFGFSPLPAPCFPSNS